MDIYDKKFYKNQYKGSIRSAEKYLSKLFADFTPSSIVDFGCGVGSWLYAAEKLGVKQLVGLDGDWVSYDQILSGGIDFHHVDFEKVEIIDIFGNFAFDAFGDLAISVEVAEHFDEEYADKFVSIITRSANLVVFGAAIPFQGGTHHVNERPQSYWIEKFQKEGYRCFDYFRPVFWNDPDVEVWYRQNTFLFARESHLDSFPFLKDLSDNFVMDVVHPELFFNKIDRGVRGRADRLRDAAVELEQEDIHLSHSLMELAHTARPSGEFIKEKLLEYKKTLKKSQDSA